MKRLPPEERKNKILQCADMLFRRSGYESIRVEDILEQENLSKGGFYHHFHSKEDVLRGLIRLEVKSWDLHFEEDGDPLEQLFSIFRSGSQYLNSDKGLLGTLNSFSAKVIYLDELEAQLEEWLSPYLTAVIKRGVEISRFRTCDPSSTTEIFLAVNNYGNRKTILSAKNEEWILSYNKTAFEVLGRQLGIENELQAFLPL